MRIDRIYLIGAGGHARVVYDAARIAFPNAVIIITDDNPDLAGKSIFDTRVSGRPPDRYSDNEAVHVAIGDNRIRFRKIEQLTATGAKLLTIKHPGATVSPFASVDVGCFLAAGSLVGPEAVLRQGVIVNHNAIVDHNCVVEAYSHVAPGAVLGGEVRIGKYALVGAGAVVLPGLKIGDGSVLGAGAILTRSLGEHILAVGIPARSR
jgi:sugar O-acyltransferase (sialic acid O-acetyltransferase NeuD family)